VDRRTDGWTEGRTDMTKLIVAFCNFANGPNALHVDKYTHKNMKRTQFRLLPHIMFDNSLELSLATGQARGCLMANTNTVPLPPQKDTTVSLSLS
jgi:hypothetical protein